MPATSNNNHFVFKGAARIQAEQLREAENANTMLSKMVHRSEDKIAQLKRRISALEHRVAHVDALEDQVIEYETVNKVLEDQLVDDQDVIKKQKNTITLDKAHIAALRSLVKAKDGIDGLGSKSRLEVGGEKDQIDN